MNILVTDTETTSIDKPFCYNLGYVIVNTDTREVLLRRDFVIDQIWNNRELFATAYYAEKRPIYTAAMRARRTIMDKWGYVQQQLIRDIKAFEVAGAYAYNSPFDSNVYAFNAEWFKTANALDLVPMFDIRGYVHKFIAETIDFQRFCEANERFTESGNYSTTAETLFQYITQNTAFAEEHTALADSEIEMQILFACIDKGAEWNIVYPVKQSIRRLTLRELDIVYRADGEEEEYRFEYTRKTTRNGKMYLTK